MKDILLGALVLVLVAGLAYGSWLIKREFNYSFDYEDKVVETVQEQQQPLLVRLKMLEKRVAELEKK